MQAARSALVRRGRVAARAAHADEHGVWRPRAARAVFAREAVLIQPAEERPELWPAAFAGQ
eukprot:2570594-Lingulodinium_polyedra.AAC.1